MLSVFRRAAGISSRLITRGLSTVTVEQPGFEPTIHSQQDVVPVDSRLSRGAMATPVKALPITPPVYLTMSTLIRPAEDNSSEEDNIVELDPSVFAHPIRRDVLHLCVTHHLDGLRQGTASTKTRGDVRGSGHKIRPQKGSGKARLGDGQSPMLRGGGVAFGPHPRDFSTKLPRKVIQMGMRVALSAKVDNSSLGVVDSLEWPSMKTKDLAARIEELGWRKTLFVTGQKEVPEGLRRSSSNIYKVDAVTAGELTVYDAVKWSRLVLDLAAVEYFEQTLSKHTLSAMLS